jgi:hypothetical protein
LNRALKQGRRSSGRGRQGLRRALVVAEFALALTLLAGAGLIIHSFWKLTRVNLGFRQDHVLTFALPISFDRFPQPERLPPCCSTTLQPSCLGRTPILGGRCVASMIWPAGETFWRLWR